MDGRCQATASPFLVRAFRSYTAAVSRSVASVYILTNHLRGVSLSAQIWPLPSGQSDLEAVDAALGGVVNLPEQLYGRNYVDFHHIKTGVSISFNALDALRGWCEEALPPVRSKISSLHTNAFL